MLRRRPTTGQSDAHAVSTKSNATQYTAMLTRMNEWNDGKFLKSDADPIQATEWLEETPEYRAYRLAIQKKAEQKSGVNAREAAVTSAHKMKVGQ